MVQISSAWAIALSSYLAVVQATPSYTANKNSQCGISSEIGSINQYCYSPSDADNVGVYANSIGSCDAGSYAQVQLKTPSGMIQCGYLALDGASHLVNCPGFERGSAPAGSYEFQYLTVPSTGQYSCDDFTINHNPVTVTAPAPIVTITVSPTDYVTTTVSTTPTDTYTSPQVLVTSPSASVTYTCTSTPRATKTTITDTITFTKTTHSYSKVQTTLTYTQPCTTPVFATCQQKYGAYKKRTLRVERNLLNRRDSPNGGEGMAMYAYATTTVTPDPVYTTTTLSDVTSTCTITSVAPDVSTTVPCATPTLTVYSGVQVFGTTTTLPQITKTRTKHSYTTTKVTVTESKTYTHTHTVRTSAICAPTGYSSGPTYGSSDSGSNYGSSGSGSNYGSSGSGSNYGSWGSGSNHGSRGGSHGSSYY